MNATIVPDYIRPDGCFNIISYFSRGAAKSDLDRMFQAQIALAY